MRVNRFIAGATGLSRRAVDRAIEAGQVTLNGRVAGLGDEANASDTVTLDGQTVTLPVQHRTIMLNKPVGYICSRRGQGSRTIYELLPAEYRSLKPVGRLDKDSSGLLLLTDDGALANQLTHPRYAKTKIYQVELDRPLDSQDKDTVQNGVRLEDGPSKLDLRPLDTTGQRWQVTMSEGRNRQIRRTFAALGYHVQTLHRTTFGRYILGEYRSGSYGVVKT